MRLLPLVLLVGRAAGECVPGKWLECRDELRQALFNRSTLPVRDRKQSCAAHNSLFFYWLSTGLASRVPTCTSCRSA